MTEPPPDPSLAPPPASPPPRDRLIAVTLDAVSVGRGNPDIEHERAVALFDLLEDNRFSLIEHDRGPYRLTLGREEGRLVFDVAAEDGVLVERVLLPLLGFRGVIRDYFAICESYYSAIKRSSPSQIEAIDMGRRGLHDEAAEQLRARLAARVALDHDTARRLFTLICVLHLRG